MPNSDLSHATLTRAAEEVRAALAETGLDEAVMAGFSNRGEDT